nr:hypothetical protein [Candidatus Sigynarchaeota archaeon]
MMPYECTIAGCDDGPFKTLLLGKIHVYQVHGKSWKKARCYLRYISAWEARGEHERIVEKPALEG